jgi:hypothetical protein
LALSINDFSAIANAILDCIQLHEQQEAYNLIKTKLDQLSMIEFESNAIIQKQYAVNIGKLKLAHKKIEIKIDKYEPNVQKAWRKLVYKLDERIIYLKRQKVLHANSQG